MFGYPPIHTCSSLQMTKIDADDKNRHGGWEPKKCLKKFFFLEIKWSGELLEIPLRDSEIHLDFLCGTICTHLKPVTTKCLKV